MKAVLKTDDGFYAGMRENKFQISKPRLVDDLQLAQVFTITIVDGKLIAEPELPEGSWDLRGVAISLDLT